MQKIEPIYSSRSYFWENCFVTEHTPTTSLRGVFVLFHGFPAWVTKNYDVGELLALLGYKVYIPHHEGLGQSKGEFQFLKNIEKTSELLRLIQQDHPSLPLSVVGHSWGGYLALRHIEAISGQLILLAPLARFPKDERRSALINGLYTKNKTDLPTYDLTRLENEFLLLEEQLELSLKKNLAATPRCLLLYGNQDEVIPPDLIKDFGAMMTQHHGSEHFSTVVVTDDHRLSKRRPVLETIRAWVV